MGSVGSEGLRAGSAHRRIADQVVSAYRHQEAPENRVVDHLGRIPAGRNGRSGWGARHVVGAGGRRWCEGGRPLEAEVPVLLVLGPLLDATDPGVDKGSRGIERGAQLLRGGWGGHALLRGEDRSRAVQVSCFANRRSVHVVSLVAPVDSHPQQARGSECHVGARARPSDKKGHPTRRHITQSARGRGRLL